MVWAFISLDWIVYPIWITSNIIRIAFTIHWMGDQRYFHLMLKTTSYKGQIFYYNLCDVVFHKNTFSLSGLIIIIGHNSLRCIYPVQEEQNLSNIICGHTVSNPGSNWILDNFASFIKMNFNHSDTWTRLQMILGLEHLETCQNTRGIRWWVRRAKSGICWLSTRRSMMTLSINVRSEQQRHRSQYDPVTLWYGSCHLRNLRYWRLDPNSPSDMGKWRWFNVYPRVVNQHPSSSGGGTGRWSMKVFSRKLRSWMKGDELIIYIT